jgi:hypothetical protein
LSIDLGEDKQVAALMDREGRVLGRKVAKERAHALGGLLEWARGQAIKHGFAGVVAGCEPTGHRWRSVMQLADEAGVGFVCVRSLKVHLAREADDYTRDKTDYKDAVLIGNVLIGKLISRLDCYLRAEEDGARLRHLGQRRFRLVGEVVACRKSRKVARSESTRPPSAISTAVSASTRPRSWTGRKPRRANADDNPAVRPVRSATSRSAAVPAWLITSRPAISTDKSCDQPVVCTSKALLDHHGTEDPTPLSSQVRSTFPHRDTRHHNITMNTQGQLHLSAPRQSATAGLVLRVDEAYRGGKRRVSIAVDQRGSAWPTAGTMIRGRHGDSGMHRDPNCR